MDTASPAKKSDLGVRTASAIVMLAVAGTALWLGGWVWTGFVAAVALGVLWEWAGLVRAMCSGQLARLAWMVGGIVYIGLAAIVLVFLRNDGSGMLSVATYVSAVIATDVGAYFAGRTIGGPKIAPSISPSKTWAGLGGGILLAWLALVANSWLFVSSLDYCNGVGTCGFDLADIMMSLPFAAALATTAQAGDFFESWMKRRAGVKDSGNLIPGHGGLFDRVDGLLAVCFGGAVIFVVLFLTTGIH